jgi:hypothetical protein
MVIATVEATFVCDHTVAIASADNTVDWQQLDHSCQLTQANVVMA